MKSLLAMKYHEELEDIYHKHLLVDTEMLTEIEEELYAKKLYLPVYIRRFLQDNYYDSPLFKEYEDKVLESRRYTAKEQVNELLQWLKQHTEYKDVLNEEVYNNLQTKISALEKEYKEALSIIG